MSENGKPQPKARILVVDDEPFTVDLIRLTLATSGLHVETAGGGEDAMRMLGQSSFDLLLLDVMMPEISGFDLMRRMKAAGSSMPPVIILSAMGTPEAKLIGLELGAIGYLVKPISRGALLDSVHEALGLSADEDSTD